MITHLMNGDVDIYLERLVDIDGAVSKGRSKKTLRSGRLSRHVLFAYDESKRMLAVCDADKVR